MSLRRVALLALAAVVGAGIVVTGLVGLPGGEKKLEWRPCAKLDCASVEVPLDYDRPGAATLSIALARLPARDPERRIGSLLVNPGGPGTPGIEYLETLAETLPPAVRARFDVVAFDPRGSGKTGGLDCSIDIADLLAIDDGFVRKSGIAAALRELDRALEPCLETVRRALPALGTIQTARDLDRIREAVGDDRLSYVGLSYGTRLGAVYAHLFPEKVRALVLDGGVTPSNDWRVTGRESAEATERALHRFFRFCRVRCGGVAEPLWRRARQLLERGRVHGPKGPLAAGYLEAATALVLSGGRDQYELLADVVTGIAAGGEIAQLFVPELVEIVDLGLGTGRDTAVRFTIACADDPARPSAEEIAALVRELRRRYPLLGWGSGFGCPRRWPVAPEPLPEVRAEGAAPIIVIGTTQDPTTPYVWSRQLADALESGVLVTYRGDGHTALWRNDTCLNRIVTRYLVDGVVPPRVMCP